MALKILLSILAVLTVAVVIYVVAVRPQMRRWGLADAEISTPLPGDELVPSPRWGFKQAITIHAPAEAVWPWIVQMGYRRAGWYSLDWVERLMGAADFVDGHSSTRIVPELQELKVGDTIQIAPTLPYKVKILEPNRLLVLQASADMKTNQEIEPTRPLQHGALNTSWTFYLEPVDATTTRLYARFVFDADPTFANALAFGVFTDGGALMMSPNQLKGIRQRAEALP